MTVSRSPTLSAKQSRNVIYVSWSSQLANPQDFAGKAAITQRKPPCLCRCLGSLIRPQYQPVAAQ
jgi:hypothetical protein